MSRMRPSLTNPPAQRPVAPLKKVLFVCIGNACRSQMAEGFARKYGADTVMARSAGLMPAMSIPPETHQAMREKNIDLDQHFPKPLDLVVAEKFDLAVNMSGRKLPPKFAIATEEWTVRDPMGESPEVYRAVRDEIEARVMQLLLTLRRNRG